MTIGYNTEFITSTTTTTSGLAGSTPQTASNSVTATTYGGRSRTYAGTANTSDAEALQVSGFWTNRQATIRATPLEVTTTIAAIEADGTADPDQIAALFDFGGSLYQLALASFTATGGVPYTSELVTTRRTISATPSNTTISVELLPAADYTSFVLDSNDLGRLGQNRLG